MSTTEQKVSRILSEDTLTLTQARAEIGELLGGKRPDKTTVFRWITNGCYGVKLDAVRVGVQWVTSRQALTRFIVARSEARY